MMHLDRLLAATVEWQGMRSTLKGRERDKLAAWLARCYPDIVESAAHEPALLWQMCKEVLRSTTTHSQHRSLSMAVLKRHAAALTRHYLALPTERQGTFQAFLERVLAECATEAALICFLQTPS